eukprot:TRINITY_DN1682_c0_g1_i1.p1 TRINITY_DN1682_c0_g1~~TRINITY_DN1682_c0_g1_i1.p1  ORF type:complete len:195 (-),score=18.60 TRINITY_DN1682_c0_g1_i1:76-660(-)
MAQAHQPPNGQQSLASQQVVAAAPSLCVGHGESPAVVANGQAGQSSAMHQPLNSQQSLASQQVVAAAPAVHFAHGESPVNGQAAQAHPHQPPDSQQPLASYPNINVRNLAGDLLLRVTRASEVDRTKVTLQDVITRCDCNQSWPYRLLHEERELVDNPTLHEFANLARSDSNEVEIVMVFEQVKRRTHRLHCHR